MSIAIYDRIPLVLSEGGKKQSFLLRYNSSTQSIRLESSKWKRSIFIGKKVFNRFLQFFRNEYGLKLGDIQYDDHLFSKGRATTSDNRRFRFHVNPTNQLQIELQEERYPDDKITVVLDTEAATGKDLKYFSALIPSILTVLIYSRETALAI
jgi:hypothetical protein